MPTVYVSEPGAQVHKMGDRLLVVKEKEVLEEIPIAKVDQLVLVGRGVGVTTAVLLTLSQRGVDIVYLSGTGRFVSRVVGEEHKHSRLRQRQALVVANPQLALLVAGAIVQGKLENQRALVRRHLQRDGRGEGSPGRQSVDLAGMEQMKQNAASAANIDQLRGFEGQGARLYYGILRLLLRPPADGASWGFDQRAYYPPPDPVNALLSFGYTLLLKDAVAACQLVGLDPYLGFFHAVDYGRPSMALDLMEPFRPIIVDAIVLLAVNRPLLRLADFSTPESDEDEVKPNQAPARRIALNPGARARFIALYETRMAEETHNPSTSEQMDYRQILRQQAQEMARVILGEAAVFRPFVVR